MARQSEPSGNQGPVSSGMDNAGGNFGEFGDPGGPGHAYEYASGYAPGADPEPEHIARPTSAGNDPDSASWRLRNWRLRYKMGVVLLVPTLVALGLGVLQVANAVNRTSNLNTVVDEIDVARETAHLGTELQRERDLAALYVASDRNGDAGPYQDQTHRVDQAVQAILDDQDRIETFPSSAAGAFQHVRDRLNSLSALRKATTGSKLSDQATIEAYSDIIDELQQADRELATTATDTHLANVARAISALDRAKEQVAEQRSVLLAASVRGQFRTGQADVVRTDDAQFKSAINEFNGAADPNFRTEYNDTVAGPAVDATARMKQTAQNADEQGDSLNLNTQAWDQAAGTKVELLRRTESSMLDSLRGQASALAADARNDAILETIAILIVLGLASALTFRIAQSMLRPLRVLRRTALNVAEERLPSAIHEISTSSDVPEASIAPVNVRTQEEIGQVARSFDAVHNQAVRLATEQALLRNNVNDLFVNLARRSQTLVQRQLALIERLEQDEQDPDQLSSLFELDHLATRMRRNSENLLILGGTDLARKTMKPVPLVEVVGAAVSEVEQYQRVSVSESPDLALQGRIVNDIVHLIAELLENATVFSNPDTEVTVRSSYRNRELLLEIRDRGVGVDADDIDAINERLAQPPEVDVAVSRRMGLYVVGQLATRNNIRVQLHNNEDLDGGATAAVRIPGEFVMQLTADGPVPMQDVGSDGMAGPVGDQGAQPGGLAAAFGAGRAGRSSPALEPVTPQAELPVESDASTAFTPMTGPGANGVAGPTAPAEQADGLSPPENSSGDPWDSGGYWESGTGWKPEEHRNGHDRDVGGGPVTGEYSVVDDEYANEDDAADDFDGEAAAPGGQYAVSLTRSTGSQDVTAVPDIGDAEFPADDAAAHEWPGEDIADGVQPSPGTGQDLFHSEYEDGNTARIPFTGSGEPDGAAVADGDAQGWSESAVSAGTSKGAEDDLMDAPTERLPIYEAVLSQWFREAEPDEGDAAVSKGSTFGPDSAFGVTDRAPGSSGAPERPAEPQPGPPEPSSQSSSPQVGTGESAPAGLAAPTHSALADNPRDSRTEAPPAQGPAGLPKRQPRRQQEAPAQGNAPADATQTQTPEPSVEQPSAAQPAPEPAPAAPSPSADSQAPNWGSGDEGWQAAQALAEKADESDTTSAGLPKRVPKSNLVPGSAQPTGSEATGRQASQRTGQGQHRSAESVRGRMSSFQQGIRRGRHARDDSDPSQQHSSHEEQE